MKKFKIDKKKSAFKQVEQLCKHFKLSKEIENAILEVSRNSYITGSNDCYDSLTTKK